MSKENIVNRVVTATLADPVTQKFLADALSGHLQKCLAGEALYIPKKTCEQRSARNMQIRQALDAGTPIDELQVRFRISRRTIFRLRGKKS